MKKILISLIFLGTLLISNAYAADIGDISLRFCNNSGTLEKMLSLTTSGQESQEICMKLINGSNKDADVSLSFVDGTITNDSDQKKACKNEGEIENFGQYMHIENGLVSVPARGEITITGILTMPEEAAGNILGCVTYFIANQKDQNEMFTIMVRRANFIDIFAKGVVSIGLSFDDVNIQDKDLSNNPKISSHFNKDEKILYIQSILKNKGTAEQGVTIKGEISNRFGYKKTFFEEKRTIFGKQSSNISNAINDLPFYKGPFKIKYEVIYNANIGEGLETNGEEQSGIISESTNILILDFGTYISLIVVLGIIAGISLFIIKKKERKVKKATKKTSKKVVKTVNTKKTIKKKKI